jgi:hypothetical protein
MLKVCKFRFALFTPL